MLVKTYAAAVQGVIHAIGRVSSGEIETTGGGAAFGDQIHVRPIEEEHRAGCVAAIDVGDRQHQSHVCIESRLGSGRTEEARTRAAHCV